MRLLFRLSVVELEQFEIPAVCPDAGCNGRHLLPLQKVTKPLRDTQYRAVQVWRYRCVRCGRTFRVCSQGVKRDHISQRLKGLGVMLYLLGLSYGAGALVLGLSHPGCKSHVKRNTKQPVAELKGVVQAGQDRSLEAIGVGAEQVLADVDRLKTLTEERRAEQASELEAILKRYLGAKPPAAGGEGHSVAYQVRLLLLDRWNLWKRLTRYRHWQGARGERIDGTNNAAERAIGWWVKERYRSMRGDKRQESALNVSRLLV
jgi:transposase-like protein